MGNPNPLPKQLKSGTMEVECIENLHRTDKVPNGTDSSNNIKRFCNNNYSIHPIKIKIKLYLILLKFILGFWIKRNT